MEASKRALEALKQQQVNRYAGGAKPMVIAIGLSVHNAPVEIRERLSVPEPEWPRAIQELCSFPHIEEAAVLSTCNRMEVYIVGLSWHLAVREVEEWLCQSSGVSLEELRPYLFLLRDRDATHHLMRVASGLDSLVLGEGQILAQVKQVHKVGQSAGPGFGRQLNGLFKQAITAGKRVRSETSISSGSVSVSSAAAELAQLKLPDRNLPGAKISIIGAGKMSTLLVKHLASKGCRELTVLNRSMPRSEALAAEFPEVKMHLRLMHDLVQCVEESDVVFAASGSEEILIHAADLVRMAPRPSDPAGSGAAPGSGSGPAQDRLLIDISVPRNIDPAIGASCGARVFNVDDLKEVVALNKEGRAQAAAEAEKLLVEELRAFEAWRDSLGTVPTIKALRNKAESIRSLEFEKAMSKLRGSSGAPLDLKALKTVEELSRGIVNKLLHGPMAALRSESTDAEAVAQTLATIACIESLFELDPAAVAEEAGRQEALRKGERPGKGGAEAAASLSPGSDAGDRAVTTSREPAGASAAGRM